MGGIKGALRTAKDTLHSTLSSPAAGPAPGTVGASGLKLPFIFLAYTLAIGFMARDPWFGEKRFYWNQGVFVILISYLVVTTLAFEWNLLGRVRGLNLLLQLYLVAPLSLLFGRLASRPTETPDGKGLLGKAAESVKGFLGETMGFADVLPAWLIEPFATPATALFLIGICIALSYGAVRTRLALLVMLIAAFAFSNFASVDRPSPTFYLGVLCLITGLILHYHNVNNTIRQEQALRRMTDVEDELERRCCLRIIQRVLEDEVLNERGAFETVRRHYEGRARSAQEVALCARTVVNRLVNEHGILSIQGSSEGLLLLPSANLNVQESLLSQLGLWPRTIILALIALIWLILPLDAVPDTIPFVGLLDDAAILLLGGMPLFQRVAGRLRPGRLGAESLA